jgi:folate-binding Fe-S cluster repair protein YgfZ
MSTETLPEVDAQYRVMREGAGLLERSERGKLLVHGSETAEFLQGQLTNEVEALAPGRGCYAALLDRKGHIQADLRALRLLDGFWLDTEASGLEPLRRHLETYKVGREVEIIDRTSAEAIVSLIGPQAPTLVGTNRGEEDEHAEATVAGIGCRVVVSGLGLDLILPAGDSAALTDALLEAGAARVSEGAAEILRVEVGRPRFGSEMGPQAMPAEAGIVERAVSFTKGQAEPPPARSPPQRFGRVRRPPAPRRARGGPDRHRRPLSRSRPHRTRHRAPGGGAGGDACGRRARRHRRGRRAAVPGRAGVIV